MTDLQQTGLDLAVAARCFLMARNSLGPQCQGEFHGQASRSNQTCPSLDTACHAPNHGVCVSFTGVHISDSLSNSRIIVNESNIPYTLASRPGHADAKLLVPGRPLILGVPCQHTLYAHADALDALDG
jgi:hypothetical protein